MITPTVNYMRHFDSHGELRGEVEEYPDLSEAVQMGWQHYNDYEIKGEAADPLYSDQRTTPPLPLGLEPKSAVNMRQDGTWWFWDCTWSHEIGPFESKQKAQIHLIEYISDLLDSVGGD